ncbi:hypothetical protein V8F06_012178 [Rhypophila decipiens]
MLLDSPSWPPNPWATPRITNSPGIKPPPMPASPEIESKDTWRQRMARYAPNQGWRFVLDHPTNPPPKPKDRLPIEEQNELAQELYKLGAQGLWQRFSQERTFAQYFSERYLAVREKATVYPGEELDDDPMLSQVVLETEIHLEINDAITHLESLLAIISHTQKTLPTTMLDIHGQDDNIELFWTNWRPTWNDAVNLWTLSCLL